MSGAETVINLASRRLDIPNRIQANPMRDFFKPWRRKVGLLTLMMACVLTAVWIRSLSVYGLFTIYSIDNQRVYVLGFDDGFFIGIDEENVSDECGVQLARWETGDSEPMRTMFKTVWRNDQFGIMSGKAFGTEEIVAVSCGWIVAPLIFVSTYLLLLSKPRPLKRLAPEGGRGNAGDGVRVWRGNDSQQFRK